MNERQNHTQYQIGDRVLVSDGAKRPPDRFNKKLASWKHNNYTATVHEIREEKSYEPYGALVLKQDDYPDRSWITFQTHLPLGGYIRVEKIEEVEAA